MHAHAARKNAAAGRKRLRFSPRDDTLNLYWEFIDFVLLRPLRRGTDKQKGVQFDGK